MYPTGQNRLNCVHPALAIVTRGPQDAGYISQAVPRCAPDIGPHLVAEPLPRRGTEQQGTRTRCACGAGLPVLFVRSSTAGMAISTGGVKRGGAGWGPGVSLEVRRRYGNYGGLGTLMWPWQRVLTG